MRTKTVPMTVLLALATPSMAGMVQPTYTESVQTLTRVLDQVVAAKRLDGPSAHRAQLIAASWVHIGPCRGKDPEWKIADYAQYVLTAEPADPLGGAVLEMVAVLTRENLGREPPDHICRFAREAAGGSE